MQHVTCRSRQGKMREALDVMNDICSSGYAASDIIQTLFKVFATVFSD